jgi:hypothetical protein
MERAHGAATYSNESAGEQKLLPTGLLRPGAET